MDSCHRNEHASRCKWIKQTPYFAFSPPLRACCGAFSRRALFGSQIEVERWHKKRHSRLWFQTEKKPTRNREERFILPLDVSTWSLLKLRSIFLPCLRDFGAKAIRPSSRVFLAVKVLLMVPVDRRSRSVPMRTIPQFPCEWYVLSHAEETALE